MADKPLKGIRVLELGQLIAGPFTASMLAYFGAEVIKIEPPGVGDPIRKWRAMRGDTSHWWYSIARNKKSVCLDLKSEVGQQTVRELAASCDVLIENFRPGVMEGWGLGPERIKEINPNLVYTRISGYGQTGPYADKAGFASVCEGFAGLRHLNGFPDEAPVRINLSIGDSIASIHAVIGVLVALSARDRGVTAGGQVVDVALYEAIFNMMEGLVPEYTGAGVVRGPSGTTVTGIVPTNTYRCSDAKYVIIGGNGDSIFKRLMIAVGKPDFAEDPAMANNQGRVENQELIDGTLAVWCGQRPSTEVVETLEAVRVPAGLIYDVADMVADPHYQARGMFEQMKVDDGEPVTLPGISPKLSETPGGNDWPGPKLGEHTEQVLTQILGKTSDELREQGLL